MAVYMTVCEGDSPATAEPILATCDPEILRAVGAVLSQRMGLVDVTGRVLNLKPKQEPLTA